jgi:anti-sigma factor ChrR (cupin superfamily)
MIHQRLKTFTPGDALPDQFDAHLDEDAICAFVEGRLEEAESSPVISHLVACASCRHTTAQLVRLESEFNPENDSTSADESPGRLRQFLERTAARVTPSVDEYLGDSVIAYQLPAEEPQDTEVTSQTTPVKLKPTESITEATREEDEETDP